MHKKLSSEINNKIVLGFLNATAIASGYADRDPQGGTAIEGFSKSF